MAYSPRYAEPPRSAKGPPLAPDPPHPVRRLGEPRRTALAPAAPLAQPTQAESELTALGARFEQALAAHEAAQSHFNACEARFLAECPDPP